MRSALPVPTISTEANNDALGELSLVWFEIHNWHSDDSLVMTESIFSDCIDAMVIFIVIYATAADRKKSLFFPVAFIALKYTFCIFCNIISEDVKTKDHATVETKNL